MANRLAREKSPYLLQHAENPVDWYPWGDEAFTRARQEDKPMLVSIGYSACHWCHVMERESFEDPETARLMNERFVNIKVDREERPDVDAIYMEAVQALTGQGGWPLNVFLVPDGRPFYGGTYFPPRPAHGMPAWRQVLEALAEAYRHQRADVLKDAATITDYVRRSQELVQSAGELSPDVLSQAYQTAAAQFDWQHGGFGAAPKFPQPLGLEFVLRMAHRFGDDRGKEFVDLTLRAMADGGLFDQLGGGFHRYSVDSHWLVPHFEKMLYDNALLARVYLQAFQATRDPFYRRIAEETLDYLLRDMRAPEGGFFSAEDADSEGVEGKYYVWTPEEVEHAVGPHLAQLAMLRYGVRPGGNFEGKTILTAAMSAQEGARLTGGNPQAVAQQLAEIRQMLLTARSARVPPAKDTKILVSWNALAVRAMAEAGAILGRADCLDAACGAADFLLTALRPGGNLVRSFRNGPSEIPAFLEDYAFLAEALITLYETTWRLQYLETARELAQEMIGLFWDEAQGAFFDSQAEQTELVVRPRSFFDNPIPSGNSVASFALLRLEALTGESQLGRRAEAAFRAVRDVLARAPLGFSYLLSALDFYVSTPLQTAIVGDPADPQTVAMAAAVFERYLPNKAVAVGKGQEVALLAGREMRGGLPTAYVCRRFACKLPVTDVAELEAQLDESRA